VILGKRPKADIVVATVRGKDGGLRANALPRALTGMIALSATALMGLSVSPTSADDLQLGYLTPAELAPQVNSSPLAVDPVPLRPGFSSQTALTNALLQSYVDKQLALKMKLSTVNTAPTEELNEQVLLGYIDRTHLQNGALDAIGAATNEASLSDSMLQTYALKYQPTVKKVQFSNAEKLCLSQAIYHEARGESDKGQWAVANVIINRAMSHKFPTTLCGVVYQNADQGYLRCQFTFACDGKSDLGTEQGAWAKASKMASAAYHEFQSGERPGVVPSDALYYHTLSVDPGWNLRRVAVIGAHEFYAD
jgi:hypothetical protein